MPDPLTPDEIEQRLDFWEKHRMTYSDDDIPRLMETIRDAEGQTETRILFALEELAMDPGLAKSAFIMYDPVKGEPLEVEPRRVKGIMEALNKHMDVVAPSARKAMQAYYDIDHVREELDTLRARLAKASAALQEFGHHHDDCDKNRIHDRATGHSLRYEERDCTCGFMAWEEEA